MRALVSLCVCLLLSSCANCPPVGPAKTTFSSFDRPVGKGAEQFPAGHIQLKEADLTQILDLYSDLSGRTVIRSPQLPQARITLLNANTVNRIEALQLFDTALATSGVAMVLSGEQTVKAVPAGAVPNEAPPVITLPVDQLPDSKSVMVRHVKLTKVPADRMAGVVTPLASLPNSIIANKETQILTLRDYSSNIRQMLRAIEDYERNWK